MRLLVTGGAGFIGSALVRRLVCLGHKVVVVDKLTYAGDLTRLDEVKGKYAFVKVDITCRRPTEEVFARFRPEVVVHCAAETHVDRSIRDSGAFITTNVCGTQVLLEASRKYRVRRFVQISTDEVYGEIVKGSFRETDPLKPNSPYAASKAACDLLIGSYIRTYGFPALIIRPCNNYGPWQYPEKLIPRAILKVLCGERVPVYADGRNVREWLYVDDCVAGILQVIKKGRPGEIYNLGSNDERENIQVVRMLLRAMGAAPTLIEFVKDRPGHDKRYRLDTTKLTRQMTCRIRRPFAEGLRQTVDWALGHQQWLRGKYREVARLYHS